MSRQTFERVEEGRFRSHHKTQGQESQETRYWSLNFRKHLSNGRISREEGVGGTRFHRLHTTVRLTQQVVTRKGLGGGSVRHPSLR